MLWVMICTMYSKIEEKKSHDVHLYDFSNVSPAKRFLRVTVSMIFSAIVVGIGM